MTAQGHVAAALLVPAEEVVASEGLCDGVPRQLKKSLLDLLPILINECRHSRNRAMLVTMNGRNTIMASRALRMRRVLLAMFSPSEIV
jgi:hypothetical protein